MGNNSAAITVADTNNLVFIEVIISLYRICGDMFVLKIISMFFLFIFLFNYSWLIMFSEFRTWLNCIRYYL